MYDVCFDRLIDFKQSHKFLIIFDINKYNTYNMYIIHTYYMYIFPHTHTCAYIHIHMNLHIHIPHTSCMHTHTPM